MEDIVTKKNVVDIINDLIKEEEVKRESYRTQYLKHLADMKNTIKIEDEYIHKLVLVMTRSDERISLMRQVRYLILEKL